MNIPLQRFSKTHDHLGSRLYLWRFLSCLVVFCFLISSFSYAKGRETVKLKGTVLDDLTGLQTPCTVAIIDSQGQAIEKDQSYRGGFRSTGSFEVRLPAGPTRIRITRGFETEALEDVLELTSGKNESVVYRLTRPIDMRQEGWYSGDSHVHMIHGERDIPVSFESIALAARAEDLHYLSLSHDWIIPDATPEQLKMELDRVSVRDCVLTWNIEAPKNYLKGDAGRCLGHGWTLGMKGRTQDGRNIIPILLDASAHDYEVDKPTSLNFESHALIHELNGSSFYTHPFRWWRGPWGGRAGYSRHENMRISNLAVELPLDTLIGPTYDGLDILTSSEEHEANEKAFRLWMKLLNHGYRPAATASSDSTFDRANGGRPGSARMYTYLAEPFSIDAIARATAEGRTIVTNGPVMTVSLNKKSPGTIFQADGTERILALNAWKPGDDPRGITAVELYRNGQLQEKISLSQSTKEFSHQWKISERSTAWYCIRVLGGLDQTRQAVSGAFFFDRNETLPLEPVQLEVRIRLVDQQNGELLSGTLTEVNYLIQTKAPAQKHIIGKGETLVRIPGTVRLRAEATGFQSLTLSPIIDSPGFLDMMTALTADDLETWATFEKIRTQLKNLTLTYSLHRMD